MYAEDWDEHYPRGGTWVDLTYPFVKVIEVYRCPTVRAKIPNGFGYVFNCQLSGRLKTNDHIPLMFEGIYLERNGSARESSGFALRHSDTGNVADTDGLVRSAKSLTLPGQLEEIWRRW